MHTERTKDKNEITLEYIVDQISYDGSTVERFTTEIIYVQCGCGCGQIGEEFGIVSDLIDHGNEEVLTIHVEGLKDQYDAMEFVNVLLDTINDDIDYDEFVLVGIKTRQVYE